MTKRWAVATSVVVYGNERRTLPNFLHIVNATGGVAAQMAARKLVAEQLAILTADDWDIVDEHVKEIEDVRPDE